MTSGVVLGHELPRGLVELDDPPTRVEHDNRIDHSTDDFSPRDRDQVEQPITVEGRQHRQASQGEGDCSRVDMYVTEEFRHVDDVDGPGQEDTEEHDARLNPVDTGSTAPPRRPGA